MLLDTPFWEKLPPGILRLFREARFEPQLLARDWDNDFPDDPVASATRTLRRIADTSLELAAGLDDWGPAADKPETPGLFDVS